MHAARVAAIRRQAAKRTQLGLDRTGWRSCRGVRRDHQSASTRRYAVAVAYDRSNLHANEQIVVDEHPHWIMLIASLFWVFLGVLFGIFLLVRGWTGWLGTSTKWLAIAAIVVGLLYLCQRLIKWYSTNFVITTDRCIYREGIISKRGIEIPLERINTVFFHQHLFERLVRAGDLVIESAGHSGEQRFEDIRNPVMVQNLLYQTMEDNEPQVRPDPHRSGRFHLGIEAGRSPTAHQARHAARPGPPGSGRVRSAEGAVVGFTSVDDATAGPPI